MIMQCLNGQLDFPGPIVSPAKYAREHLSSWAHVASCHAMRILWDCGRDITYDAPWLAALKGMVWDRRSLTLHNCGGLKDAQLVSRSIEHLSLANCRGLATLVLDCPSLLALQVGTFFFLLLPLSHSHATCSGLVAGA